LLLLVTGGTQDFSGLVLNPLVRPIVLDLGLHSAQLSWILVIPSLVSAITAAALCRAGDRFGHRGVIGATFILGIIGSLVGAFAANFEMLLVSRVLLGLSGGAVLALVWGLVKSAVSKEGVQSAALLLGTVMCVVTPLSLTVGGLFIQLGWTWRSTYWLILVLLLVSFGLLSRCAPTPRSSLSPIQFEPVGTIGLGIWLFLLVLPLSQGTEWGWLSQKTLLFFLASAIIFCLWFFQQRKTSAPMIDLTGMDRRQLLGGFMLPTAIYMIITALYVIVPLIGQLPVETGGYGMTALDASLMLMPILPAAFIASWAVNKLLPRIGARGISIGSGLLIVVAFLTAATFRGEPWQMYFATSVFGLGGVAAYNLGWAMVSAAGRPDNTAVTVGLQNMIVAPASAVMVAVTVSLLDRNAVAGVPQESSFTILFLLLAATAAALIVVVGLFLPSVLTHSNRLDESTGDLDAASPVPIAGAVGGLNPPTVDIPQASVPSSRD
jgi:predicted MFS family arabinose efflux permease